MRFLLRRRGALRRLGCGVSDGFSRWIVSCTALPPWSGGVRPPQARPSLARRPGRAGCWVLLLLLEERAQPLLRVLEGLLRVALTADHRVDDDVRDARAEGPDADRAGVVRVPVVDALVHDLLGERGHQRVLLERRRVQLRLVD